MTDGGRIEERIASRRERVHVLTGAVCNNNCIFCMEEDRDGRYETNSATTDETVRWILDHHRELEEICFTSGEPTTNPALPRWVKLARAHGVPMISIMTNGRALSYERYAKGLVAAGMNRFYISIHGHEQRLHEGLTRTPDSFAQTLAGIDVIASLKRYGVSLHTSTVVTRRNLPHLGAIYRFLREHGVEQVVFNVMQANGRANTYFEQIFPAYSDIAASFAAFVREQQRSEPQVMAFLVDIPLCTTRAVPDFNRGYVESYVHFEPAALSHGLLDDAQLAARESGGLVQIRRADLDDAQRHKRSECASCRYDAVCEGVWGNYLARYGWDEFVPELGAGSEAVLG
ncbi:MAG: radical SAM protein [Deltaproteobacteria bacterium]|nr:radical SAM protein [Nannocystaceae bacterium]